MSDEDLAIKEMKSVVKKVYDAMSNRQSFVFYSKIPTVGRHTILKRLDQKYDLPYNWRWLSVYAGMEKEVFSWLSYSCPNSMFHVFRLTCSDVKLKEAKKRLPYMRFIEIKSEHRLRYDDFMKCMGKHNPCQIKKITVTCK